MDSQATEYIAVPKIALASIPGTWALCRFEVEPVSVRANMALLK
jgi:hypothetical protein